MFNGNFEDSLANSLPGGWEPHPELFDSVVGAIDTLNHRVKMMYRGIVLVMLSCFDGNSLSIEKLGILYAKLESGLDEPVVADQESNDKAGS